MVLKGKRVSQLRVCRRTGHRTIGVQYQLGEILQVMGQKHRPRMRVTVAGCARHHPAWLPPSLGELGRPPLPGWPRPSPSAPRRTWRVWEAGVQSSPQAFCKDPPTSRQPSRRRLAGAASRACAAVMASTTEGGGGATSQRSLRGAAGLPRVPSASASAEGLGKVFWSYSYAKWCRPGE